MKKKTKMLIVVGATVMVLLCAALYFGPISLSNVADGDAQMQLVLSEFGIENGEPDIDSVAYNDITPEESGEILTALEQYTYGRTVKTLFSDGTVKGDKILYLHFDGDSVAVTSAGEIAVRGKTYRMKNAEEFIERIIEILE